MRVLIGDGRGFGPTREDVDHVKRPGEVAPRGSAIVGDEIDFQEVGLGGGVIPLGPGPDPGPAF